MSSTRTVAQLGEVRLIQRLRKQLGPGAKASSVLVGIGDDTAVLRWTAKEHLLFASDMLVENVHFRRERVRPRWIGWKALARNVSDVAAMGGLPRHAVVSLGLPPHTSVRFADEVYAGLWRCARRFGLAIVGGDTVRAPVVVVDVAILGTVRPAHLVLRSGARVGDEVFVTGRLGGSLASGRHATFMPRVQQAQWLVRHLKVHAMMDLSDGLASDLWQMSRASRVTFRIRAADIPVSRAACPPRDSRGRRGRQAVWHALMDGEDFELVCVVPARAANRVPRMIGRVPVTAIGDVVARGAGVELVGTDGRIRPLIPEGFKHF
ncbi:MAG: thiamine-monophosphate kinase [Candidatus Omnitrophica bacterium]|nr:thiamine-monophosphate kinase [Candidatus Omnitrophota bacterium]